MASPPMRLDLKANSHINRQLEAGRSGHRPTCAGPQPSAMRRPDGSLARARACLDTQLTGDPDATSLVQGEGAGDPHLFFCATLDLDLDDGPGTWRYKAAAPPPGACSPHTTPRSRPCIHAVSHRALCPPALSLARYARPPAHVQPPAPNLGKSNKEWAPTAGVPRSLCQSAICRYAKTKEMPPGCK